MDIVVAILAVTVFHKHLVLVIYNNIVREIMPSKEPVCAACGQHDIYDRLQLPPAWHHYLETRLNSGSSPPRTLPLCFDCYHDLDHLRYTDWEMNQPATESPPDQDVTTDVATALSNLYTTST
jgi:hypothetical protein